MGPEEFAIRTSHSTWIEAVNAGDLVCLLSLMTDDVVFLSPGNAPINRAGFPPGFSGAHQRYRVQCVSDLQEVAVVGEVAYTWTQDALTLTAHSSAETLQFAGHRITIYRKHPDGRWLLARDAHTLSPVQKKPS